MNVDTLFEEYDYCMKIAGQLGAEGWLGALMLHEARQAVKQYNARGIGEFAEGYAAWIARTHEGVEVVR